MRIFLAVFPPLDLAEALYRKWADLQNSWEDVRWVQPENYHITLLFLGKIDSSYLPQLRKISESIACATAAFDIVLGDLKWYGLVRNPRVLVGKVASGRIPLSELHYELSRALGIDSEKREFDPHITIGRISRPGSRKLISGKLFPKSIGEIGINFRARKLALVQSELKPKGAQYSIMDGWNFMEEI